VGFIGSCVSETAVGFNSHPPADSRNFAETILVLNRIPGILFSSAVGGFQGELGEKRQHVWEPTHVARLDGMGSSAASIESSDIV
jgi:hypothetical protein